MDNPISMPYAVSWPGFLDASLRPQDEVKPPPAPEEPAAASLVLEAAACLKARLPFLSRTAMVLGSGFGPAAERLDYRTEVPYADIPGFAPAAVAGHAGVLMAGVWSGLPLLVLSGRAHYYEGHSFQRLAFPARVLKALGVRRLILTAAVGAARRSLKPGSLAVLRDHLNFMGGNPLRGPQPLGTERFVDLSAAYSPRLRRLAERAARRAGVSLRPAVHAAYSGPSYETPAEVRAARLLGADTVGMSIVPEAIAARALGLEVLALVGVANAAAGLSAETLTHAEVLERMDHAASELRRLLDRLLGSLEALP